MTFMDERTLRPIMALSILAALVTLGLKTAAWWLTGSVGLLADAAESVVNLVAAGTAYFSLWYAAQPVDANHTYGHEKIEYFSSGLEGVLIMVAAAGIAWMAGGRLLTPQELQSLDIGVMVGAAAALVNLGVARVLIRVGRARHSIVLEADGQHLMTDVWTSAAVIAGVGLVQWTNVKALDPLCALAMAGNILWTGFSLVRRSFDGLMDHALPIAEQTVVRSAIERMLEPGVTYHALRTRQAGSRRFIDFHLLLPGATSVKDAHDIVKRIEAEIAASLPGSEITIHVEPIEDPEAWSDSAVLRVEQQTQRENE
jgi:cation diffusion facilitator family transporter